MVPVGFGGGFVSLHLTFWVSATVTASLVLFALRALWARFTVTDFEKLHLPILTVSRPAVLAPLSIDACNWPLV